jgi:hypothetical protein
LDHERIDSKVSIEVTLLPRMTCKMNFAMSIVSIIYQINYTHHCANGMLLRRSTFLHRVVDDKVQEEIVAPQNTTDFAAALEMDKELLIHKLGEIKD